MAGGTKKHTSASIRDCISELGRSLIWTGPIESLIPQFDTFKNIMENEKAMSIKHLEESSEVPYIGQAL